MVRRGLTFVAVLAACGAPRPPPTAAPLPSATAHAAPRPQTPHGFPVAHWVPRIAPGTFGLAPPRIYGPVQNNFGTLATTYLGHERVGMVVNGGRAIWQSGELAPVTDATLRLAAVTPIAPALGGGFVFTGGAGVFFSPTFSGPLRKLDTKADAFRDAVGPGVVLCGMTLASTKDGRPAPGAPRGVTYLFAHRERGFAVAVTAKAAFFTSDGRSWKPIRLDDPSDAAEDGDTLVVLEQGSRAARVHADGRVEPVKLSDDERIELRMRSISPKRPAGAFAGSFLDGAWQPTGRTPDEWYTVRDRRILVTHERSEKTTAIGTVEGDSCLPVRLEQPLVGCVELGSQLTVYRLDLASGVLTLEKALRVKKDQLVRQLGTASGSYPVALSAAMTCAGDADAGWCVRDDAGAWHDLPKPSGAAGMLLAFPGEIVGITSPSASAWEVRSSASGARTVAISDAIQRALGPHVSQSGALRVDGGVDLFYEPMPFEPVTSSPVSHVLFLPLDGAPNATLGDVPGVVASAGRHALRLDRGKLYETDDGWVTWQEVPPPPSGPLHDLAGAMCFDAGCVVGPWARLGWEPSPRR